MLVTPYLAVKIKTSTSTVGNSVAAIVNGCVLLGPRHPGRPAQTMGNSK